MAETGLIEMSPEERWTKIERFRANNPRMSNAAIAKELGVSTKTIGRDLKEMEAQGRVLAPVVATNQAMRDEVFERVMDTYDVSMRAMQRTEAMVEAYASRLKRELEYKEDTICPTCKRPPLRNDPLAMQSYFKGESTMNEHLTFRAKLLGQIADNPTLVIMQQDEDLAAIIEEIGQEDVELARRIWRRVLERSARRQRRMPSFPDIIDGNYRQVEEGM